MMDGDITVSSRFGEGTRFTVAIEQTMADNAPCASLDKSKKYHFFICEPDEYCRESILKTAKSLDIGCTLIAAGDIPNIVSRSEAENYLLFDYKSSVEQVKGCYDKLRHRNISPVAMIGTSDFADDDIIGDILFIRKPVMLYSIVSVLNGQSTGMRCGGRIAAEESSFICPTAKLLIVDDNLVNLRVAEGLMSVYGAEITLASSGFEALELIEGGSRFDIIFMDHMMPKMDGVETTQKIRRLNDEYAKTVPIVALTANAMKGVDKAFIEAGMNDFLAKPIDTKRLAAVLSHWISKDKQEKTYTTSAQETSAGEDIVIRGVNTAEALKKFSGDANAYLSILKVVHGDGYKSIKKMRDALQANDIPAYTIEVHAMKSVCASIGAAELSQAAFEQEKAGKAGDLRAIESGAEKLLTEYGLLLESIAPYVKEQQRDNSDAEQLSADELRARLDEIMTLIGDFEGDKAIEITDSLLETRLPDEMCAQIRELREMIDDYDYDGAGGVITAVLNEL